MTPVVVFAYNRKDKIEKCLNSLSKCNGARETKVFVFSDGPKNDNDKLGVKEVREVLKNYKEKNVFRDFIIYEAESNKGLAQNIICGINSILAMSDSVIVVEDDLIFSNDFLEYMNKALSFYKNDARIGEISGYHYPINELIEYKQDAFLLKKGECWGWGTWKDRWEKVDWNVECFEEYMINPGMRRKFDNLELGFDDMLVDQHNKRNNSWAIRWCFHLYLNNLFVVYPKYSKVSNCGFDGSGTHCSSQGKYVCDFHNGTDEMSFDDISYDKKIAKKVSYYPIKSIKGTKGIIFHLLVRELKFVWHVWLGICKKNHRV